MLQLKDFMSCPYADRDMAYNEVISSVPQIGKDFVMTYCDGYGNSRS